MIKALILIGLGGGAGSMLRYLVTFLINKQVVSIFPLATFFVNFSGCLLIGILLAIFDRHFLVNHDLKFLFITGFCGGYTTFSTFSLENINLLQSGNYSTALLYIFLSVFTGFLAVWFGLVLGKNIYV